MKLIPALGLLLLATAAHAQELDHRPDAPKTNNPIIVPSALITLVQERIYPNTVIPDGMVWVPRGRVWHAEELNSCEWCGRPMTFKHAAFDKKMSSMFLLEVALTMTDVELGQACMKTGRCREGNPLLGGGSRSMQYGIRLPSIVAAWMDSAWARKGDHRLHIGGLKHWYVLPLIMHAEAAIGIASGIKDQ